MRRVLVLGGTGWLGRAVARELVACGDEVVCLARGDSGPVPDGARLVRADRRETGAYDDVRADWDEVVELAYEPGLVGPALHALAPRAAHWTLVSTISVYARADVPGADETAELVEPEDLDRYPDAKVASERLSTARVGDRLLTVRPGLIVGPGDPSDRFGYWPARLSRGGRVLTPATGGRWVQVVDVDDLAAWIAAAGRTARTGVVDAVGPSHPMDAFLRAVAAAAGFTGDLVAVPDEVLAGLDVRHWAGSRSLPLWLPASDTALAQRSGAAFAGAGASLRTLAETVARVLDDERRRGVDRARRSGLAPDEEAAVLAAV